MYVHNLSVSFGANRGAPAVEERMDTRLAEVLVDHELERLRQDAARRRAVRELDMRRRPARSALRRIGTLLVGLGTRLEAAAGPAPESAWPPATSTPAVSRR